MSKSKETSFLNLYIIDQYENQAVVLAPNMGSALDMYKKKAKMDPDSICCISSVKSDVMVIENA